MKSAIVIVMGIVLVSTLCKCTQKEEHAEYKTEYHYGHNYVIRSKKGVEQMVHDPNCSCNKKIRSYYE